MVESVRRPASLRSLGRITQWSSRAKRPKRTNQSTRDLWFGLIEEESKNDNFIRLGAKRRRFPHALQARRAFPVLDPHALWRVSFDACCAAAVAAAVILVPLDLAFTNQETAGRAHPIQLVINLIDIVFMADIVLKFNTAIFDEKRDEWCVDRGKIARRYLRRFAILDLIAIVPWRYGALMAIDSEQGFFRPTTLRRLTYLSLFKLLRVARLFELERNWRSALGFFKHKDRVIMKYVLCVCVASSAARNLFRRRRPLARETERAFSPASQVLHYEACGIRFAHNVQTKRGDVAATTVLTTRGHAGTPLLDRDGGSVGMWVEYVICLDWALSTMLAESVFKSVGAPRPKEIHS